MCQFQQGTRIDYFLLEACERKLKINFILKNIFMQPNNSKNQSQSMGTQQNNYSQGQKQVDGPDEPIVNEQEQNEPVNKEDAADQNNKQSTEKEKGYKEGNKNDSDTDTTDVKNPAKPK